MSRRLDVVRGVLQLLTGAVPGAVVVGLDDHEDAPVRLAPGGRIVVRAGDPGEPEIDLSPLTYNWTHRIPVEVLMPDEDQLDAALVAIGAAIDGDRQLGGLCDWLDAEAPATQNVRVENARSLRGAPIAVTAIYATDTPL